MDMRKNEMQNRNDQKKVDDIPNISKYVQIGPPSLITICSQLPRIEDFFFLIDFVNSKCLECLKLQCSLHTSSPRSPWLHHSAPRRGRACFRASICTGAAKNPMGLWMFMVDILRINIESYVCIYIYTYTYIHIYIYVYILYTHTHIYIYRSITFHNHLPDSGLWWFSRGLYNIWFPGEPLVWRTQVDRAAKTWWMDVNGNVHQM